MDFKPSYLVLENGITFPGFSPAWQQGDFDGEVVFNTGMTGYPESLTDPSYAGQILNFTYPLIGNYGVPHAEQWESKKIHAHGVVTSQVCREWSHHSGLHSFLEWLKLQNIPLITGVDTRSLTKLLRESGTMLGAILEKPHQTFKFNDPNQRHLVSDVSISKKITYKNGKKTVIAVDCGMKENILRSLAKFPLTIHRVPHDYDYTNDEFDGIFLSNGPGDPVRCQEALTVLKKALKIGKPIMGICLGTQLLALASGAKTYRLPYGHRGHNQPCIDVESKRCYITSQNHGYAVDEKTLSKDWKVSFRNLNDQSVEGICHQSLPYFSVQFHPEATPGPTDTLWLFEKFYASL